MGAAESTFDGNLDDLILQFDKDHNDCLSLDEIKELCLYIWEKEKMPGKPPKQLAKNVFDLLDADGDGNVTREEFQLLFDEVWKERQSIVEDSGGVKQTSTTDSWLGYFGLSSNKGEVEEEEGEEIEEDPEEILVKAQSSKKKKKSKSFAAEVELSSNNNDEDLVGDVQSEGGIESERSLSSSDSEGDEVSLEAGSKDSESESEVRKPRVKSKKRNSTISEFPSDNEAKPVAQIEQPAPAGWFGRWFGETAPVPLDKPVEKIEGKTDKSSEQESAPFWRAVFSSSPAPPPQSDSVPSPVPLVVPIENFLFAFPVTASTTAQQRFKLNVSLSEEYPDQVRLKKPWPSEVAPTWKPPKSTFFMSDHY
jgi:hypothetical protein